MGHSKQHISLTLAFLLLAVFLTACGRHAANGDVATVTYTGAYQNGTVFDTNDPSVISELNLSKTATPLVVQIGKGMLVPGFEKALVGMKEGEKKSVTISAKDAYGGYDASKVITIPKRLTAERQITLNRTIYVPKSELQQRLGNLTIGKVVQTKNFFYNITAVGDNVTLYLLPPNNGTVALEEFPWQSKLVSASKDFLVYEHLVDQGQLVNMNTGPYNATVNQTHIILDTLLKPGQEFSTAQGIARVTRENLNSVYVDFNHPLAGQTLVFNITLDSING